MYQLYALPNGTAIGRSQLYDAGIGFDDGNRLRVDLMAFRQTVSGAGYGTTGGSGISTVWQIAPSLAVRSWYLISQNSGGYSTAYNEYYAYGGLGDDYVAGTANLNRNVTWLTAGNVLRVDVILRGGKTRGRREPAGRTAYPIRRRHPARRHEPRLHRRPLLALRNAHACTILKATGRLARS